MDFFNSEEKRRLDTIERHLERQFDKNSASIIIEAELSGQLKELAKDFKTYVDKESIMDESKAEQEEKTSTIHLKILNEILLDIQKIKQTQKTYPTDVSLMLANYRIESDKVNKQTFASIEDAEDIEKTLLAIKKQLMYLWTVVAIGCSLYLGKEKLLPLLALL